MYGRCMIYNIIYNIIIYYIVFRMAIRPHPPDLCNTLYCRCMGVWVCLGEFWVGWFDWFDGVRWGDGGD